MEYLTVKDMMSMLKVGRTKAYQLLHEPGFPRRKIGRKYLIPKAELDAWLAEQDDDWITAMASV